MLKFSKNTAASRYESTFETCSCIYRVDAPGGATPTFPSLLAFLVQSLPLRNITGDLGCTHDPAGRIRNGRRLATVPDLAILRYANSFIVIDALAALRRCQDFNLFLEQLRWNDDGNGLSNRLRRREAKHAFSAVIPTGYKSMEIFGDDRIIG